MQYGENSGRAGGSLRQRWGGGAAALERRDLVLWATGVTFGVLPSKTPWTHILASADGPLINPVLAPQAVSSLLTMLVRAVWAACVWQWLNEFRDRKQL